MYKYRIQIDLDRDTLVKNSVKRIAIAYNQNGDPPKKNSEPKTTFAKLSREGLASGAKKAKRRKKKGNFVTIDEVVFQAQQAAKQRERKTLHGFLGVGYCTLLGVLGLPASILHVELLANSKMDSGNPFYMDLDPGQKIVYEQVYKKEEKRLRRKGVYSTEIVCSLIPMFIFFIGLSSCLTMPSIRGIFSCTSETIAIFGGPVCPAIEATGRKDCTVPLDVRTVESGAWRSLEFIYFNLIRKS